MSRILLAIAILLLMAFVAWKQHKNPPQPGPVNAVSEAVVEVVAGNAIRAKHTAEDAVDAINQTRLQQLQELDKFQER